MTRLVPILLAGLSGCVIYDLDPKPGEGDPGEAEPGYPGEPDDPVEDSGGPDDGERMFELSPGSAAAGTTAILHLTVEGDYALEAVEDAEFLGPVSVTAFQNEGREVLIAIRVAGDAAPGPVDLVLYEYGGRTEYLPDAFEVLPGDPSTGDDPADTGDCG